MSGSATDPGNRSSAEIERDVEHSRARLSGTLDELRDRAQPGQIFEQVLDYAKQSGGADMARNLGQQMRDNPLPLLLIGAGIGWLMLGGGANARSGGTAAYRPASTPRHGGAAWPESAEPGGASLTDRAAGAAGAAKDRVGDAAGGLRDSIAGAVESASEAVSDAYGKVTQAAGSMADGASDAARSARDRAAHLGEGARQGLHGGMDSARGGIGWLVSEQPLVLGALGLAVGAAIGALLPGTETEDRLMGETRDRLVDQARDTAEQGYERVKVVAGEQLGEAKRKLDESGLSPDRMGDALTQTARQLKDAVSDVARDAGGQARTAMDDKAPGAGTTPARPT